MNPTCKKLKDKGVALLMVLATLALLSGVVVEFAYNSNVTYNLAMNDLDRVQAYYLAQSGINFSKLILKFDKEAQKVAKDASKKMNKEIQIQPLYEMIPINTALFRAMAGMTEGEGGEKAVGGPAEEEGGEGAEEKAEEPSALEQGMNLIDTKGTQDFLQFNGDFSAEIQLEDAKINLNQFYGLNPKTDKNKYDRLKSTLYHLLVTEEFKGMFEDRYRGAKELAQNIADFIDKDEVRNEPGGEERGRELVGGQADTFMKNGKLLSVEELVLVPGMTDDIFQKLKPYVTLYGPDEKIYICRAQEPLVRALIIAYTENNPKMEPLSDDNEELLTKASEALFANCPSTANMSKELDLVLGVTPDSPSEGTQTGNTSTRSQRGQTTQGSQGNEANSTSQNFTDLVKDSGTIYSVVGIGTVGESEVKLKTVLDTAKNRPQEWPTFYWRVE